MKCGIIPELRLVMAGLLQVKDFLSKSRDFEHLLFNPQNSRRILEFGEFVKGL